MVDTPILETNGQDDSTQTSYTTASVTPPANDLIVVIIQLSRGGTIAITSVIGNGITYDEVDNSPYDPSGNQGKLFIFRGQDASPSAGTIVISTSGGTHAGCSWGVYSTGNVPIGNNGADAIQQSANAEEASGTSVSTTLASFQSGSICIAAGAVDSAKDITPDSPLVESYEEQLSTASDTHNGMVAEEEVTSPGITWSGTGRGGIVAIEILDAGGAALSIPVAQASYRRRHQLSIG